MLCTFHPQPVHSEFVLQKPGATHHARFMGKSLYILKIFIMSHMFARLTPRQQSVIDRMTIYIVTLYGRYFLKTTLSEAAPMQDLDFFYDLKMYHQHIDKDVAHNALDSLKRHLWYLTPELVMLGLFNKSTTIDQKQLMAATLVSFEKPCSFSTGKPEFSKIIEKLGENRPELSEFINEQSWLIFEKAKPYIAKECSLVDSDNQPFSPFS